MMKNNDELSRCIGK